MFGNATSLAPVASVDVRFWGQSGQHLLILSFSAFDPKRTKAGL
jgi:hypothetical protein